MGVGPRAIDPWSCERTAWKTSSVASRFPAAARLKARRSAVGVRTEYQTVLPIPPEQPDTGSCTSVPAPTVVPEIVAGRLWIACAPAIVSFPGAGGDASAAGAAAGADDSARAGSSRARNLTGRRRISTISTESGAVLLPTEP